MPEYHYKCDVETDGCGFEFVIQHPMNQEPLSICPECKKNTLFRVIHIPEVYDMTPKTLGMLAERNRSKMGVYEYQEKDRGPTKAEITDKLGKYKLSQEVTNWGRKDKRDLK